MWSLIFDEETMKRITFWSLFDTCSAQASSDKDAYPSRHIVNG
jgi:hypothetical protein